MAYLATVFLAAMWAVVERTRAGIANRTRKPAQIRTALSLDLTEVDPMTARELEAERETAQLLLSVNE
jgi:hypothetical protein